MRPRPMPAWTWIAPLLIAHLGTELSRATSIATGVSAIYLPIPLGLVMVWWWGPRALAGVYLNAVLSAGLWGLSRWPLYPVYALPEVIAVAIGALAFERGGGRAWLPRVPDVLKFVFLAIVPAALFNGFGVTGLLIALGDLPSSEFW